MSRKKEGLSEAAAETEIDLKPFINFLVVLIPVLMLSAVFSEIAIINIKLPEGRGSQTSNAVVQRQPQDEDQDKLLLTIVVTDSVVTIGAKGGFLPSLFYTEFHKYVAKDDRTNEVTIQYDPRNPGKVIENPKTSKPFSVAERQEIILYVTDDNGAVMKTLYTQKGEMLTNFDGKPVPQVKAGDTVYTVTNPRRLIVVNNPTEYTLSNMSAYDEMKNRLLKIKERFREASDASDIIIAAENQVAYDKIIQLMDVARAADFPNISIAKLRG